MQTGVWRLSLLGAPHVRSPEGRAIPLEGKSLALLTVLVLDGSVTRVRLADWLWPDASESTGRNNLVILLRRLQQRLGQALWRADERITLLPETEVDVSSLLPLLSERKAAPGDALYRSGILLDGHAWPELPNLSEWLLAWRERLDALRGRLALDAALHHELSAHYPQAREAAQHALRWNPVSEEAYRVLMRLAYLTGDRDAARRAYEACCTALQDRLQTGPLPATQALAALIRRGGELPQLPAPPTVRPVLLPARLIGREHEWAQMERAWQHGQAIILVGEAGAGKSRLAADFVASKGEALLFDGRPGDTTVPYATAVRHLRQVLAHLGTAPLTFDQRRSLGRLLPELNSSLDGTLPEQGEAHSRDEELHRTILEVLASGLVDKVAMVADDLQFSDDASIEISTRLSASGFPLGRPGGRPVMVMCYRRGELTARHEAALTQLQEVGHAARIEVGPLDESSVVTMLEGLKLPQAERLGQDVMKLSGGNAMFVLEAARHLLDVPPSEVPLGMPPRLEHLILQRLDRLSTAVLPVARAASILQREFSVEQIAAMLGRPLLETAAAWDELERAEIVVGERFSHDLLAEAILGRMSSVVRRLLHRAAARMLAGAGGDPARVAQQWLEGAEPLEAVPWLLKAVTAAQRAFRHREALAFAAQAAALLEEAGRAEEAFEAWNRRAHLLADLEDQDAAQIDAVRDLHRTAVTPAQQAQAYSQEARLLFRTGDTPGMLRVSELGLALARGLPGRRLEAELQEAVAIALLMSRRPAETYAAWTRLLELATDLQDERMQASAHEGLGYLLSFVQPLASVPHYQQAERGFVAAGDVVRAASTAQKAALLAYQQGDVNVALETLNRAERYVHRLEGHLVIRLMLADSLSRMWLAQEHFGRALDVLDQAEHDHASPGTSRLSALVMQRALLLLRLGDPEQARGLLEPLLLSESFPSNLRPQRNLAWTEVLAALGRTTEAWDVCQDTLGLLAVHDEPFQRVRLLLMRASLLPAEDREAPLREALAVCEQHGFRGLEAAVRVRLSAAALSLGQAGSLLPADLPDASQVGRAELWRVRLATLRQSAAPQADLLAAENAARDWLAETLRQVPERYRQRFVLAAGLGEPESGGHLSS